MEVEQAKAIQGSEPSTNLSESDYIVQGSFLFDATIGYQITKSIGTRLAYVQSNSLLSEGRYNLQFLSKNNSRAYIGVDYSF